MIRINTIYTRVGDKGRTRLADGREVDKCSPRIEAVASLDELNAAIGSLRTEALLSETQPIPFADMLIQLQNDIFDLGAAVSLTRDSVFSDDKICWLESEIDAAIAGLPELRSFVLPGGSRLNCGLHSARTATRRAERRLVALAQRETVPDGAIPFLNRLSDLFFALCRWEANRPGHIELLWHGDKHSDKHSNKHSGQN